MPSTAQPGRAALLALCLCCVVAAPLAGTAAADAGDVEVPPRTDGSSPVHASSSPRASSPVVPASTAGCSVTGSAGNGGDGSTAAVASRHGPEIETFVAPGRSYDRYRNASALSDARETGELTPAAVGVERTWDERVVAAEDTLVHRVGLNGTDDVLARLAAAGRGSPTENFRALVANGTVGFRYMGSTACPPRLALNATVDRGALRVVPNRANDTLWFVFDTDRLLFHPHGEGEPTRDTFVMGHNSLSVTLPAAGSLPDEVVTVESSFQVEHAQVGIGPDDRGVARLGTGDPPTVVVRSNLAPGRELSVALHPVDGANRTRRDRATVNDSRTAVARFDGLNRTGGRARTDAVYRLSVRNVTDGPPAGAPLVVVGNGSAALVAMSNRTADDYHLSPVPVSTTDGGFLVVRNATGDRMGTSDYVEAGGTAAAVRLTLTADLGGPVVVSVHRDVDGDRRYDRDDRVYRVNGTPVRDSAVVRYRPDGTPTTTAAVEPTTTTAAAEPTTAGATPTPTPTTTPATSGDPGTDAATASTTTGAKPTTERDGPGFGVLLALLAVSAGLLLAARD